MNDAWCMMNLTLLVVVIVVAYLCVISSTFQRGHNKQASYTMGTDIFIIPVSLCVRKTAMPASSLWLHSMILRYDTWWLLSGVLYIYYICCWLLATKNKYLPFLLINLCYQQNTCIINQRKTSWQHKKQNERRKQQNTHTKITHWNVSKE